MATIKILEYYSVPEGESLDVDMRFYINKLTAAEYEQDNLTDVLAWQCAADVLTVMGEVGLAQKAIDNVNLFIALNTI